jgi:hypothetical protein
MEILAGKFLRIGELHITSIARGSRNGGCCRTRHGHLGELNAKQAFEDSSCLLLDEIASDLEF